MISGKLSTAKDKTRACVDLYLCNPDHEPSWRDITSALYKYGKMAAARKAKSFLDHHQNGEQCHLCIKLEEVAGLNFSVNCHVVLERYTLVYGQKADIKLTVCKVNGDIIILLQHLLIVCMHEQKPQPYTLHVVNCRCS